MLLLFSLPKALDIRNKTYYNVWTVRQKQRQIMILEAIAITWVLVQVFGNEAFMVCVSGCV